MKVVWKGKYTRLFVGKHHNYADRWRTAQGGKQPGQHTAVSLPSGKYLFVGLNVVEYTLPETMTKCERTWATLPFRTPWPDGRTHAYLIIIKSESSQNRTRPQPRPVPSLLPRQDDRPICPASHHRETLKHIYFFFKKKNNGET